jgi:hypothetical protein
MLDSRRGGRRGTVGVRGAAGTIDQIELRRPLVPFFPGVGGGGMRVLLGALR